MSSRSEPGPAPDFGTWFEERATEILRDAYFVTRDPKLAEDIAQEAALKCFKAWANEEQRGFILTKPGYVRTTILRCFLDHIKVRSRTNLREVELDVERHDSSGLEIDHDLRLAVLQLDGDEQDMIVLHYYHDLTIGEAGSRLGLSPSQAYRLHTKALANLAGLLDEGEA